MSVGQGTPTAPVADPNFSIGDAVNNVLSIAPSLKTNPPLVTAAAQANIGSTQVETLGAYNQGLQLERFINSQDPAAAQSFYNTLGSDDQTLLANMGYTLPSAKNKSRSIWGDIKHVGSDIASGAGSALRGVQHTYRTVSQSTAVEAVPIVGGWFGGKNGNGGKIASDQGGTGQITETNGNVWTPSSFVRAWRSTSNGSRAFNAKDLAAVRNNFDGTTYDTALRFAEGDTIQDIAGTDPTQIQNVVNITNSDDFKQAYAQIKGAQLTQGHAFAQTLGIKPGTGAYSDVSGTVDGISDWMEDPTLAGGKLVKAAKLVKWGIRGADSTRIETLMATPQAQRGWGYIADRLNTIKDSSNPVEVGQATQDITRHFPTVTNLIDPLVQQAKTADSAVTIGGITDYLSGSVGMTRMMSSLASREAQLLPGRLSKFGEARLAVSDNLHVPIDFLTDARKYLPYDKLTGGVDDAAAGEALDDEGATQAAAAVTGTSTQELGDAAMRYRRSLSGRLTFAARRLTTRVPIGGDFNADAPEALDTLRKVAQTYLPTPRVNQIVGAFAGSDLAGKRSIYYGMLQELGHASGITMSESGSKFWAGFTDDLEYAGRDVNTYSSVPGAFVRNTDSGQRALAGLTDQMSNTWKMPGFNAMHAQAARIGVMDRVMGGLNQTWVDGFMGKWRSGVLTRLGFPMRAGGDEAFNGFWRGNGAGLLQARLARSLAAGGTDPNSPTARVISKMIQGSSAFLGLPTAASGADYAAQFALSKVRAVLTHGAERLLDPDYIKYVRLLNESPTADTNKAGIIEDIGNGRQNANPDMNPEDIAQNVKFEKVNYRPTGAWSVQSAQGFPGALRWAHGLEHVGGDAVASHIALNPDSSFEELWPELHDIMQSPHYQDVASKAEIANWTKAGGSVKAGTATQEDAYKDWASDIYSTTHSLLRDKNGNLIRPVVNHFAGNGDAPSAAFLNNLTQRPEHVTGPDFLAFPKKGLLQSVMDTGWSNLVARPMNYISRQPVFTDEYVKARVALQNVEKEMLGQGMSPENVESIIGENAEQVAHARAIKFVHNPAMRSQFSVITRNIFPFRHAEEGALQRWSNAMVHSPEGLRRAQLTYEGLRHSGIVTKDDQGNDYFAMPGSSALVNLGVHLANILPGVHVADLPIPVKLGFQVKFISPFLTQALSVGTGSDPLENALSVLKPIIPPGGPIVAMSLSVLNKMFKESRLAQDAQDTFVGPEGQGKPIWEQFAPSAISRLYGVWGSSDDRNSQLASSTKNAIQYLEAAGLTPPAGATPDQVDAYLNRVKSWSRTILTMRSVFGFASPAAPTIDEFSPKADEAYQLEGIKSMTSEFYKLTATMPYTDALATFVKLHPDDSPFTVGQSESPSGAQLPSTSATLDWMDSHEALLKKYPDVAPYLMPQDPGAFNFDAYKEQLAIGVRDKKSISQFYTDLKVRGASDEYFAARDARDAAIAQAQAVGNKTAVTNITANWHDWSTEFQGVNPLFAAWLAQGGSRQQQQQANIATLTQMVDSGDINQVVDPQTAAATKQMTDAWAAHVNFQNSIYNRNDKQAVQMRASEQQQLGDYLRGVVKGNPSLQSVYNQMFAAFTA